MSRTNLTGTGAEAESRGGYSRGRNTVAAIRRLSRHTSNVGGGLRRFLIAGAENLNTEVKGLASTARIPLPGRPLPGMWRVSKYPNAIESPLPPPDAASGALLATAGATGRGEQGAILATPRPLPHNPHAVVGDNFSDIHPLYRESIKKQRRAPPPSPGRDKSVGSGDGDERYHLNDGNPNLSPLEEDQILSSNAAWNGNVNQSDTTDPNFDLRRELDLDPCASIPTERREHRELVERLQRYGIVSTPPPRASSPSHFIPQPQSEPHHQPRAFEKPTDPETPRILAFPATARAQDQTLGHGREMVQAQGQAQLRNWRSFSPTPLYSYDHPSSNRPSYIEDSKAGGSGNTSLTRQLSDTELSLHHSRMGYQPSYRQYQNNGQVYKAGYGQNPCGNGYNHRVLPNQNKKHGHGNANEIQPPKLFPKVEEDGSLSDPRPDGPFPPRGMSLSHGYEIVQPGESPMRTRAPDAFASNNARGRGHVRSIRSFKKDIEASQKRIEERNRKLEEFKKKRRQSDGRDEVIKDKNKMDHILHADRRDEMARSYDKGMAINGRIEMRDEYLPADVLAPKSSQTQFKHRNLISHHDNDDYGHASTTRYLPDPSTKSIPAPDPSPSTFVCLANDNKSIAFTNPSLAPQPLVVRKLGSNCLSVAVDEAESAFSTLRSNSASGDRRAKSPEMMLNSSFDFDEEIEDPGRNQYRWPQRVRRTQQPNLPTPAIPAKVKTDDLLASLSSLGTNVQRSGNGLFHSPPWVEQRKASPTSKHSDDSTDLQLPLQSPEPEKPLELDEEDERDGIYDTIYCEDEDEYHNYVRALHSPTPKAGINPMPNAGDNSLIGSSHDRRLDRNTADDDLFANRYYASRDSVAESSWENDVLSAYRSPSLISAATAAKKPPEEYDVLGISARSPNRGQVVGVETGTKEVRGLGMRHGLGDLRKVALGQNREGKKVEDGGTGSWI
jgi:hypothetical protein